MSRLDRDFEPFLHRWNLAADGEPIVTHTSRLLPVRRNDESLMLKVSHAEEERFGGLLMLWWDGEGAVRVVAHEGDALLMERAEGPLRLSDMARNGEDDAASRILCDVAARLHAPRPGALPEATPLDLRFRELWPAAQAHGGVLEESAVAARALLETPREVRVLHGDLHHENVLDGGDRGFLAIDPKRLVGERGFDFANIFCNPDATIALAPGRLARQADVVAEAAGLDRSRLLRWILAYAGLSAAWHLGDGSDPTMALAVAEIALIEIQAG
ncbi:aminoglycoside phosphotransferase family protein [Kaistia terrae]|uniref:Aminoglycoside phosphotransferase family protein n=1 Tax=Kaistia terrae TaxID=537017 RepID=A0ABW0PV69_9HYPH|nr:aminoglycoside phosphotransferase family protein [Kaistia terrae]MCX5577401.1 phosphotransferase [Kaistia terrae]